ncbi:pupal cuticle protein 20-like [Agrilus planipennis]|uniref:Pupal cuticle protein 20-like n=1 Tax=Agrilus planipennis TaxID=224129 RepID=A0A1W4XIR7_AGRPL|nr:pupal cuticle protein 20-like [Agrilus planipennis]
MKLIVMSSIITLAFGARLDTNYLPPLAGGSPGYSGANAGPPSEYTNDNNGDGNYRYSYQSPTGINAQESGRYEANLPEGGAVVAQGSFSFTAPDGQTYSVQYTADENGFHPTGAHLPTPPPIPDAIARSLAQNGGATPDNGGYRY